MSVTGPITATEPAMQAAQVAMLRRELDDQKQQAAAMLEAVPRVSSLATPAQRALEPRTRGIDAYA